MVAAYSKVHISLSFLLIALTSLVCGTVLEVNDKSGAVLFGIATAAVTGLGAIAVPTGLKIARGETAPPEAPPYLPPGA